MPEIVFVGADGTESRKSAQSGESVMEVAVRNNIPEIKAECGGALACATCHVYLDPGWIGRVEEASDFEQDMVEMAENEVRDESRLSCQIKMSDALDGIRIHLPQ